MLEVQVPGGRTEVVCSEDARRRRIAPHHQERVVNCRLSPGCPIQAFDDEGEPARMVTSTLEAGLDAGHGSCLQSAVQRAHVERETICCPGAPRHEGGQAILVKSVARGCAAVDHRVTPGEQPPERSSVGCWQRAAPSSDAGPPDSRRPEQRVGAPRSLPAPTRRESVKLTCLPPRSPPASMAPPGTLALAALPRDGTTSSRFSQPRASPGRSAHSQSGTITVGQIPRCAAWTSRLTRLAWSEGASCRPAAPGSRGSPTARRCAASYPLTRPVRWSTSSTRRVPSAPPSALAPRARSEPTRAPRRRYEQPPRPAWHRPGCTFGAACCAWFAAVCSAGGSMFNPAAKLPSVPRIPPRPMLASTSVMGTPRRKTIAPFSAPQPRSKTAAVPAGHVTAEQEGQQPRNRSPDGRVPAGVSARQIALRGRRSRVHRRQPNHQAEQAQHEERRQRGEEAGPDRPPPYPIAREVHGLGDTHIVAVVPSALAAHGLRPWRGGLIAHGTDWSLAVRAPLLGSVIISLLIPRVRWRRSRPASSSRLGRIGRCDPSRCGILGVSVPTVERRAR